ncbi:hypothetical protein F2Q68_00015212 [Brassica cretica]|uniref:Uncharacterized protein n=1 Tax=Brassica cretica TaxID=69181 RepID=A0A8S9HK27_BRACR|nr:hypothetical protein F2Q68_00015212 [Brassica cretica]
METRFDREGGRNEAVLDSRISDGGGRRRRHDTQRLGFRFVIARERSQRETSGGFRWRDTKRSRLVLANAGEKEVSCGVSNPSEIKELSIIKELHLRTVKEFKIDS